MGALYLLNIYYRSLKLTTRYLEFSKIDFSFGSKVFSVKRPDANYVVNVINNQSISNPLDSGESPFILKYTDLSYKNLIIANQQSLEEQNRYFNSQPEMQDPNFLSILAKCHEKELANPKEKLIPAWELCKFRLNQRIPTYLSFEQRKELLVSSPEWRGRIRLQNKHLNENELTPENIQREIDHAGVCCGMELGQRFDEIRMQKAFVDGVCEIVIDNGKIEYPEEI